jgi:hypothetical protein
VLLPLIVRHLLNSEHVVVDADDGISAMLLRDPVDVAFQLLLKVRQNLNFNLFYLSLSSSHNLDELNNWPVF